MLQKYASKIAEYRKLEADILAWRARYGSPNLRPALSEQGRPAGGLSLRAAPKADGSPAAVFVATAQAEQDAPAGEQAPHRPRADGSPAAAFAAAQATQAQPAEDDPPVRQHGR